ETLGHGFGRMHVRRRGHVPARVARAPVVIEFRTLRGRKAGLFVEAIRALNMLCLLQEATVQALNYKNGGSRAATVQDGEGVKAQFAQSRTGGHGGRLFVRK